MPWWFLWFGFFLNYQYTASASKRRSDRRKRSSARLAIHLHRKGIRPLSVPRFRHLFTLLSKHHSKDPVFISQLKFEMANQQQKAGWLCGTCKKMRSPSSWFCEGGIYASQGPAQTAQPLAPPPPPLSPAPMQCGPHGCQCQQHQGPQLLQLRQRRNDSTRSWDC